MTTKERYATLNVLYLKMIQYEKHLGVKKTENAFDIIDTLLRRMEEDHACDNTPIKRMGMGEMLYLSKVPTYMKKSDPDALRSQFESDHACLLELALKGGDRI